MSLRNCWRAALGSLLLAAMTLAPGAAQAQDTGRIVGQVTTAASMRPLEGAQVFVEGLRIGGLTNAEGRFLILNVPAGTHTVRVENLGFASASRTVTVTGSPPGSNRMGISLSAAQLVSVAQL